MTESNDQTVLATAPEEALYQMIEITKTIIAAYEQETNDVALGKDLDFLQNSQRKLDLGTLYQLAAEEFMARKNEFVGLNPPQMQELIALQQKLKSDAQINMNVLSPLNKKAEEAQKEAALKEAQG